MSVTDTHRTASRPRTSDPTRTLRLALAVLAPLGALAVAFSRFAVPHPLDADPATALDALALNPGYLEAQSWLRLLFTVALLPGVLAAGLAAVRGAPRLATAGLLVAFPAWACALAFPDTDGLARALFATNVDRADGVALFGYVSNFSGGAASVTVGVFVVGHIVGTVLLGIALWRSRGVPRLIGAALAVSQPLHFVAFVVLGNAALDTFAYCLTALGFAAAGVAFVRQRPALEVAVESTP